jgi:predicted dehydrogenase
MPSRNTRRTFIRNLAMGSIAVSPGISTLTACVMENKKSKLGIALVGLGSYSTNQLGPALKQTSHCYLAGIVTGTPSKESSWASRYSIPKANIYNYKNFDDVASNSDIDIIYVVLPVSMHKEFTIRAAKAGKHVICEKPMALNANECDEMIAACKNENRKLSIGYRLHFEPHHQEMMRLGQQKVYGPVTSIETANGFVHGNNPDAWRLKKAMAGGGGLMDMGVYTIQASRYVTGEEPLFVTAREEKTRPQLFREVDETVRFELEFPGGMIAHCRSSYNENISYLKVKAEKGDFELFHPTYYYGGIYGRTPAGEMDFPQINQQAAQMDDFALCVRDNKLTRVPGEMGRQDMKIVDAIYRSLRSGKKESI